MVRRGLAEKGFPLPCLLLSIGLLRSSASYIRMVTSQDFLWFASLVFLQHCSYGGITLRNTIRTINLRYVQLVVIKSTAIAVPFYATPDCNEPVTNTLYHFIHNVTNRKVGISGLCILQMFLFVSVIVILINLHFLDQTVSLFGHIIRKRHRLVNNIVVETT